VFEQTFVTNGKTKRERTIALALILQTLGITGLALLPLLYTDPIVAGKRFVLLPPAVSKPEPPVIKHELTQRTNASSLRVVQLETLTHRLVAPTHVVPLQADDAPTIGMTSSANAGFSSDLLAGISAAGVAPPPIPHIPLTPKPPRAPLRVSSGVTESHLLVGPKPAYPKLALAARITGTVRLQATISREGRIENLHVLTGHPLLNPAAMEAVRGWIYRPLLLNGDPVEVITEIDVNFILGGVL
jgi:protein TonB